MPQKKVQLFYNVELHSLINRISYLGINCLTYDDDIIIRDRFSDTVTNIKL